MIDDTLGFYNTADLREAARRRLPKGLFEYMTYVHSGITVRKGG